MTLTDILSKAAPWLAAAAAGPAGLAGMAIKTVAEAVGAKTGDADAVAAAVAGATPEQLAALKQAELDFQERWRALGVKEATELETIAAGDRQDARAMQIANKSFMPAVLSAILVAGYLFVLTGMMVGWLKATDSQALLLMLGSLSTGFGMVLSFWFGTTRGSEDKTRLLAQSPPVK